LILVRTGPSFIFFYTKECEQYLFSLLENENDTSKKYLGQALEESSEANTIAFVLADRERKKTINENTPVILAQSNSSNFLLSIINQKIIREYIFEAELGPGLLLMKIPPHDNYVCNKISFDYQAESTTLVETLNRDCSNWSIVCFTSQPLSRPLSSSDILDTSILIKDSLPRVYQQLRRQSVKYLTEAINRREWHEYKINIYDLEGRYDLQYQRLVTLIEELEMGFILGETWSVDHPFVMFPVTVYQVRLFSILPSNEVKRIIISLEYDEKGNRLVDLDLYYQRKRIEWGRINLEKGVKREEVGFRLRREYFSKITSKGYEKILKLEEALKQALTE